MKKALNVIAAVVIATLVMGEAASAASSSLTSNFANMSAAQIVNLSLSNAQATGACTNTSQGTAVGYTFGSTTKSSIDQAQQSTHFNKSTGQVLLIKGRLYVNESAALISLQFGKADPKWANKWISIPKGNSSYVPLSSGLLFSSMMSQVRPTGTLHKSKLGTLNGVLVIAIAGSANPELGLTRGVETLFVAAKAPYLPVKLLAGGRSQGVPTSLTVTFSHWGRHLSYSVPRLVTPISATDLP
ncbi:MAG: hypothetical protein HKL85_06335 [Acidimicrobiaceae bacterium]|nr:hypothetical protein [Acidimicrobiaceae bacterium]